MSTRDATPSKTPLSSPSTPSLTSAEAPRGVVEVEKTRKATVFKGPDGALLELPADWSLLPPGDPALTRRVKAAGACWSLSERRGRKVFSQGILAPTARIERLKRELEVERANPAYQKKLDAGRERRRAEEAEYARDFAEEVRAFLAFSKTFEAEERTLARRVADHATPVGSGTVARTERIPIEERAEAAVIAWLRHQTTAYDDMTIPRVKGLRREVRRMLADRSRKVLAAHRVAAAHAPAGCALCTALAAPAPAAPSTRAAKTAELAHRLDTLVATRIARKSDASSEVAPRTDPVQGPARASTVRSPLAPAPTPSAAPRVRRWTDS